MTTKFTEDTKVGALFLWTRLGDRTTWFDIPCRVHSIKNSCIKFFVYDDMEVAAANFWFSEEYDTDTFVPISQSNLDLYLQSRIITKKKEILDRLDSIKTLKAQIKEIKKHIHDKD